MGATTQWLFKGLVIYTRFFDEISLDDIATVSQENMHLLHDADYRRVNLIVDSTALQDYPHNLKALRNVMSPAFFASADWMILISNDYFHNHLAQIFARLFQVRYYTANNLHDAYHFLQVQMAVPAPQAWPSESKDTMPLR